MSCSCAFVIIQTYVTAQLASGACRSVLGQLQYELHDGTECLS